MTENIQLLELQSKIVEELEKANDLVQSNKLEYNDTIVITLLLSEHTYFVPYDRLMVKIFTVITTT